MGSGDGMVCLYIIDNANFAGVSHRADSFHTQLGGPVHVHREADEDGFSLRSSVATGFNSVWFSACYDRTFNFISEVNPVR